MSSSPGGSPVLWVLDDGPFGTLSACVEPAALRTWPSGVLSVTSTTAADAGGDQSGRRRALLTVSNADGPVIGRATVMLGGSGPEAAHLTALHAGVSHQDLAEHEAIAWLHCHDAACFVTRDRRASLTALAELGRQRVAHPFDFWLALETAGLISGPVFRSLCEKTKSTDMGLPRMPPRLSLGA